MEQLQAKKMKLIAMFSEVIESQKKKLLASSRMKEAVVGAVDDV